MPTAIEKVRTALDRGFWVDNLRTITDLSLAILRERPTHPAIFLTIATISRWIADAWDDVGPPGIPIDRVEGQLKPLLENLLNLAEADAAQVALALDEIAVAFDHAIQQGLDSDFPTATSN